MAQTIDNIANDALTFLDKNKSPSGGGDALGALGYAGLGTGIVSNVANIAGTIDSMIMRHKQFKEQKRQFDKTFNENIRQFGLEFALKDYATRKGISQAEAQQMLNAEQFGLAKQTTAENLKTSALGRNIQATEFQWAKEDRAKKQAYGKALQKGLMMGIMGGGK